MYRCQLTFCAGGNCHLVIGPLSLLNLLLVIRKSFSLSFNFCMSLCLSLSLPPQTSAPASQYLRVSQFQLSSEFERQQKQTLSAAVVVAELRAAEPTWSSDDAPTGSSNICLCWFRQRLSKWIKLSAGQRSVLLLKMCDLMILGSSTH